MIKEESSWHVGNGCSISIWDEKWIQDEQGRKPKTARPDQCSLQKVQELMHPSRAGWNERLVRQVFAEDDAKVILRTPISALGVTDRLTWHFTKDGQYSVNSGYTVAKKCQKRAAGDEGTSSRVEQEDGKLWRKIWNLDIKRKIQHFIWRAVHNRLPVSANLRKRGIAIEEICKQCGEDRETVEHVFFHCAKAKLFWKLAPFSWEFLQPYIFIL